MTCNQPAGHVEGRQRFVVVVVAEQIPMLVERQPARIAQPAGDHLKVRTVGTAAEHAPVAVVGHERRLPAAHESSNSPNDRAARNRRRAPADRPSKCRDRLRAPRPVHGSTDARASAARPTRAAADADRSASVTASGIQIQRGHRQHIQIGPAELNVVDPRVGRKAIEQLRRLIAAASSGSYTNSPSRPPTKIRPSGSTRTDRNDSRGLESNSSTFSSGSAGA